MAAHLGRGRPRPPDGSPLGRGRPRLTRATPSPADVRPHGLNVLVFGGLPFGLRWKAGWPSGSRIKVVCCFQQSSQYLSPMRVLTATTEDGAPVSSARAFTQADWPRVNGIALIHRFKWHRGTFSFEELTTDTRRAGVGAIVGAASRAGRERLRGSSPPRSTGGRGGGRGETVRGCVS